MKNNNNNLNIIPVIIYNNASINKSLIYKENKRKSGIYCWYNNITNKSYIGSSINLSRRFYSYFSISFLNKATLLGSSLIYNSLLKYGHSNFSLYILEYCESNILISREQYYIDNLKPYYNILSIAGSRFGSNQTESTKISISKALKGRVFSDESKIKMREARKMRIGTEASFFGKSHSLSSIAKISITKTYLVKIINIETKEEKIFLGNLQAANYLGIGESTLRRYKKLGKILNKKYIIINY